MRERGTFRTRLTAASSSRRVRVGALVFGIVGFLAAGILGVFYLGTVVAVDGAATRQGTTNVSLIALMSGADLSVALLVVFLWIGVEDRLDGRTLDPLYWPMLLAKGSFALYMGIGAPQYLDFYVHGLAPRWYVLYTPFVRIVQSAFLLSFIGSFAAILGVILRGRGWSSWRLVALYAAIALSTLSRIVIVLRFV